MRSVMSPGGGVRGSTRTALDALASRDIWLDISSLGTLFQDDAEEIPAYLDGHPVRSVRNKGRLPISFKAFDFASPPRLKRFGDRWGLMGGMEAGRSFLVARGIDLSGTQRVSAGIAAHRDRRAEIRALMTLNGPIDSAPAAIDWSLRVGHTVTVRDLDADAGTSNPQYRWDHLTGDDDMVLLAGVERDASLTANKMWAECDGVAPTIITGVTGSPGTGAFPADSFIYLGGRPVTGGNFTNQALLGPVFQFFFHGDATLVSDRRLISNWFASRAKSTVPGIRSWWSGEEVA